MPRLKWLEIQGYRAFSVNQRLEFAKDLALVWGGNSQGKTSVAEAIEFLLTGDAVRRTLLGGERSEYNDSLRCAHHPAEAPVQVRAGILDEAGVERIVVRALINDIGRGQDCTSDLTIDGSQAADLSGLGIVLADPPLRAPVLFQHSLRYALTAGPRDRLTYFKALLEVSDLDVLTAALTSAIATVTHAPSEVERALETAMGDEHLRPALSPLNTLPLSLDAAESAVCNATKLSLASLGLSDGELPSDLTGLTDRLDRELDAYDQRRFDFAPWRPGAEPSLEEIDLEPISTYATEIQQVDAEAERLRTLFDAVLAIPAYQGLQAPTDCPVCATPNALTPARVTELRNRVAMASGLQRQRAAARNTVATIRASLRATQTALTSLTPRAATFDTATLDAASKQATAILDREIDLAPIREKAVALAASQESSAELTSSAQVAASNAAVAIERLEPVDLQAVSSAVRGARAAIEGAAASRTDFLSTAAETLRPLREQLDAQRGTTTHRALLMVARATTPLVEALRTKHAISKVRQEYETAKRAIDRAKLAVLNAKFAAMSDEIERWWKLLRPDEPADFVKAAPRGQGQRGVSLEAALHGSGGTEHVRDALGVFSDSQLNALGLAAFLARASLQQTPLVVLDDPLQAGDEAHRDTFIDHVVPKLLDAGFQVVITTYDHDLNKLLSQQQDLDGFQVSLDDPSVGSVVVKGNHTAAALLQDAKGFISEGQSARASAANRLRVAAEATAKEILVTKRTEKGERASLADYSGDTLGRLISCLEQHLPETLYRWWTTVPTRLNPGSHDDAPPERNTLSVVHSGLLRALKEHGTAA